MKLVRYGLPGQEKPGILDKASILRDLSDVVSDITPDLLAPERLDELLRISLAALPIVSGNPRLGPPLTGIGKIVCIGLNYADHAAESGLPVPEKPTVFLKATTAISGPMDKIVMPRGATAVDWEIELGVVIGRKARYVDEEKALDYVAGYCVANDVSERNFSEEGGGQWTKGKSADTFAPLGPWLVTKDEIPDPQNLHMHLDVNDRRFQNSSTAEMVFGVAALISYVTRFMTLMPGDVMMTGTPYGTGYGQKPQVYLKPGDVMLAGIENLGEQCLQVIRPQ